MSQESAVKFAGVSRIHMGLATRDLEDSLAFYRVLFGQEPTKTRPGYVKFEVAEPPVNLSLNETCGATGPSNAVTHFGIQVKSTAAVQAATERLKHAGYETRTEDHVSCCYAVQNKVWAKDPDGNKWEVYVVLDNDVPASNAASGGCCPGIPSIVDAVQRGDLPAAVSALEQAGGMSACACLDNNAN